METNIVAQNQPERLVSYSTSQFPEGLYVRRSTGAVLASLRSAGRLIDKSASVVSEFLSNGSEGVREATSETAEVLTAGGVQRVRVIPESVLLELIAKYKPDLLAACAAAGLRVFLHRLAGFEVTSTAIAPVKTDRELTLEAQLALAHNRIELEKVKGEVHEVKKLLVEKQNYILKAAAEAPGLQSMMLMAQDVEESELPVTDRENWTLHEWMVENKKIHLEGTMFKKFVSKVHGAYKAVRHEPPMYAYRPQVENPKQHKKVQVYTDRDFGILTQCYHQTLLEA